MKYKDIVEAHSEKVFKFDGGYELILSAEDPWKGLDSVIDFVRRWNRRVPIGRNKEKIKDAVLSLKSEFDAFERYGIEDLEFTQENNGLIRKIFDELSNTPLKSTGTTKLMHGMNPGLFVMWDKGIQVHYGVYPNSAGYINFMRLMQDEIIEVLKEHSKEYIIKELDRTLPKLMDEYNWMNFRTSKFV